MSFNREDINIRNDASFIDGPDRLGTYTRSIRKNERPNADGYDDYTRGGNNDFPANGSNREQYSEFDPNPQFAPRQALVVNTSDYSNGNNMHGPTRCNYKNQRQQYQGQQYQSHHGHQGHHQSQATHQYNPQPNQPQYSQHPQQRSHSCNNQHDCNSHNPHKGVCNTTGCSHRWFEKPNGKVFL